MTELLIGFLFAMAALCILAGVAGLIIFIIFILWVNEDERSETN